MLIEIVTASLTAVITSLLYDFGKHVISKSKCKMDLQTSIGKSSTSVIEKHDKEKKTQMEEEFLEDVEL